MGRRRNGVMTVWGGAVGVRALVWCGVGGLMFMLLTSALGIAASAYWPHKWKVMYSGTSQENSVGGRVESWIWDFSPAWSTVLLARFPERSGSEEEAAWRGLHRMMSFSMDLFRSSHLNGVDRFGGKPLEWWIEYRTGWPWPSLSAKHFAESSADGVVIRRRNFVILSDPISNRIGGIVVPYGPVWSGIVGNSLVGAIGIWALVVLPAAVRLARRRRRGCCVACGYELAGVGGGVCPECGGGSETPRVEESA